MVGGEETLWDARARQSMTDGEQAFERLLAITKKTADTG